MNKILMSLFLIGSLSAEEDLQWIRESTLPIDEEARTFLKEMYTTSSQEEACCQRPASKENLSEKNAHYLSVQTDNLEIIPLTRQTSIQVTSNPETRPASKTVGNNEHIPMGNNELCLVFVSFSLPLESWKEFSHFLKKTGGIFVMRGIPENSFPLFSKKIQELRKEGIEAPIEINPEAFEQYDIQAVPALVLVSKGKNDKVTGNITPEASLKMIEDRGETAAFAKRLQKQMNQVEMR